MIPTSTTADERRKWFALAVLCVAFFMDILDVAIVNVALPTVQKDLDFSQGNLAWVVSAYALTYGGLLLLGGRTADLLGRRRIFMLGVLVFGAASLIAGLAWSDGALIGARAIQGIGAAMMTPAALSILTTTFKQGAERNKALGFWGAVGASGGTIGVLLGGILTDTIGWQWIFFINVPMALAVLVAAPLVLDESFARTHRKRFDVAGAATVTGGVALLVYALVEADGAGWGSTQTIGLLVAAGLLLVSFVAIERRSKAPLMPFSMFRIRTLTGANVAGLALGASVFGMIFIVTLYMQQVLGYTPIEAGLGWLAMSVAALAASMLGAQVVTRVGPRLPITVGLTLAALGLGLLSSISAGGSYATDLLVGLLVFGVGLGLAFVAVQIGALNDVADKDAGLASGLINTMQQVGGALGVAVLSTIAISQTGSLLGDGTPPPEALADGFSLALWAGAAFSLAGAAAASILLRGQRGTAAEAGEISGPPEAKAEATR